MPAVRIRGRRWVLRLMRLIRGVVVRRLVRLLMWLMWMALRDGG